MKNYSYALSIFASLAFFTGSLKPINFLCVAKLEGHETRVVRASFNAQGHLLTQSHDGSVFEWNTARRELVKPYPNSTLESCDSATSVMTFDYNQAELIHSTEIFLTLIGHSLAATFEVETFQDVSAFSLNSRHAATVSSSGSVIKIWDVQNGIFLKEAKGVSCAGLAVALSADNKTLLLAAPDGRVWVFREFAERDPNDSLKTECCCFLL
jgi:WD40 repeat protein